MNEQYEGNAMQFLFLWVCFSKLVATTATFQRLLLRPCAPPSCPTGNTHSHETTHTERRAIPWHNSTEHSKHTESQHEHTRHTHKRISRMNKWHWRAPSLIAAFTATSSACLLGFHLISSFHRSHEFLMRLGALRESMPGLQPTRAREQADQSAFKAWMV